MLINTVPRGVRVWTSFEDGHASGQEGKSDWGLSSAHYAVGDAYV